MWILTLVLTNQSGLKTGMKYILQTITKCLIKQSGSQYECSFNDFWLCKFFHRKRDLRNDSLYVSEQLISLLSNNHLMTLLHFEKVLILLMDAIAITNSIGDKLTMPSTSAYGQLLPYKQTTETAGVLDD